MLTVGSLFAGIGGFDLGLERAGMHIKWQVEIDAYCQRVLAKHWPTVPRFGDIRTIDWRTVEPVDVLCGGFPCQDVSRAAANQRRGIEGARSGLWTEYVRAIRALRPRYILVENVPGLLDDGIGRVLGDLAESGYDAEWTMLSACIFGAPHTRERVFIVAYANRGRQQEQRQSVEIFRRYQGQKQTTQCNHWRACQPGFMRVVDGFPGRVDRLRGLGNAIVPHIAEALGRMILEADDDHRRTL